MSTEPLGELCLKIGSGATPRGGEKVYQRQGVALIRSQNVRNDGFDHQGLVCIDAAHAHQLANVAVSVGDVLLNITGESVARVCQVPNEVLPARVNQHVAIIRPHPERLDARYLRYTLLSPDTQARLHGLASAGATRRALTKQMISSLVIQLPELAEQRAIAGVLGALDDKIELNRRMNETLDQLAREMFSHRFLESRSNNWLKTPISDLCSTQYGYTASSTLNPIGPRFLRVMDINKRPWIDWATVPYCEIDDDKLSKYKLERGDIVVARMADPGKSAIVEDDVDAVFASYLVRLKTKSLQLAYFLHGFLQSSLYREYTEGAIGGSVQRNMNARVITGTDVRLPPEAEIKAHFAAIEPLRARLSQNVRESRTLAELRDALLPKLISGELRVCDAEALVE